jgi:hypothetical protein
MAFMRESAARRAEEGLPFDAVLTAYHIGVQVLWDSLAPDVRPDEVRDLMAVNSLALRCLELVTPAVGAGYLDERRTALDDESSARQALLSALLSGVAAELATAREGLHVPPGYLVLAVAVHPRPDDLGAGGDATVAGRRRLGRLRAELHRQAGGPVLSSLTPDGGIVLLERPRGVGEPTKRDRDRLDRLVADVGRVAGADLTVGVTAAEPAGVAAAAEIAREVLAVVRRSGRAPGVYQLDDVLLDYQLSRPGAALERLAAILLPLAGSDELVETLATFLRAGGRRPAASELHVHPNTGGLPAAQGPRAHRAGRHPHRGREPARGGTRRARVLSALIGTRPDQLREVPARSAPTGTPRPSAGAADRGVVGRRGYRRS